MKILLLDFTIFSSILLNALAAENWKYAPKVNLSQTWGTEWWTTVIQPREWPFDTFVLVSDGPNKKPLDLVPVRFWIIYKGNDTNRPSVSQLKITPGENIHTFMETFCDEAGFVEGSDSLACRGVELKGHVSEVVYGNCYTTTRPLATMDDYVASRTTVIIWLIHRYGYQRYLEIGCDQGITFATIQVKALIHLSSW